MMSVVCDKEEYVVMDVSLKWQVLSEYVKQFILAY